MRIKVFSPIDGTIGKIEELNDGVFSEKMLGDGFFIRPEKDIKIASFYSPIENGTIQFISDTKHAFFIKVAEGINILMHIGLDTVKLEGKPFNNIVDLEQKISLSNKIVDVNVEFISNAGLDPVCPITISSDESEYEFKLLVKNNIVKKGELVGEFIQLEKVETVKKLIDLNDEESVRNFFSTDDAYIRVARKLNNLVGTQTNYDEVYNCMTRLRFKVRDKSKVDIAEIKKIDVVKGIVWNGLELQIIIGQDVYRYKEAVSNIIEFDSVGQFNLKSKANAQGVSLGGKIIGLFSGIMIPIIPVFVGTGLVSALIGILSWTKVMPNMGWSGTTSFVNYQWYWILLFTIGKTSGMFLGVVIAASASKYFGLRLTMGIAIGVTLCSPSLFLDGGSVGIGNEWKIFEIHHFDPTDAISDPKIYAIDKIINPGIECQEFKVFVIMMTIYTAKKIDDYLMKVIPPVFELTLRSFLTFFISCILSFMVFLQIWNIIEGILCLLFCYASKIPFGISVGLYGALWQIAVVFGMHMALGTISGLQQMSTMAQGGYGQFSSGSMSVYAMLGAMIGLMIVTKNEALRTQCKGLLLLPLLGITEPILYGIAVPRKKTFWSAIAASFVAGTFLGFFNVTVRLGTGMGLFEIIGYFNYTNLDPDGTMAKLYGQLNPQVNGLLYIAATFMAVGLSIGFSIIFSESRKHEKNSLKSTCKNMLKLIKMNLILKEYSKEESKLILKNTITNFKNIKNVLTKEELEKIKEVEKNVIKITSLKNKLSELIRKETAKVDKLNKKGAYLVQKNKISQAKLYIEKINLINNEEEKQRLMSLINEIHPDYNIVEEIIKEKLSIIEQIINNEKKYLYVDALEDVNLVNSFYNDLNEMRLEYRVSEMKSGYGFFEQFNLLKSQIKQKRQMSKNSK